jgi:hypothetical protein
MSQVRVTYPVLDRSEVVEKIRKAQANLQKKIPISKMILYGSYAQGRHTAGSDIDIIVVYKGKERRNAYKTVVKEIDLPRLEPKVYTEKQFNALIADSPRFAETLRREGIVILGDS